LLKDGRTDRQSEYYRAPAISGALTISRWITLSQESIQCLRTSKMKIASRKASCRGPSAAGQYISSQSTGCSGGSSQWCVLTASCPILSRPSFVWLFPVSKTESWALWSPFQKWWWCHPCCRSIRGLLNICYVRLVRLNPGSWNPNHGVIYNTPQNSQNMYGLCITVKYRKNIRLK
jgi:hypothetical protein